MRGGESGAEERASTFGPIFDRHVSAVTARDLAHDRETKPGAIISTTFRRGAKKRIKDTLTILDGNARPIVEDRQMDELSAADGRKPNMAMLRAMADRIVEKVAE